MLRPVYYDDFKCTGDKCTFTCCQGWDIELDSEACIRRLAGNCEGGQLHTASKSPRVKPEDEGGCPFQSESGLCSIVLEEGEDAIPDACIIFPRLIYEEETWEEASLSFSCPAVIDLLWNKLGENGGTVEKLSSFAVDEGDEIRPGEAYFIREKLIGFLEREECDIGQALTVCYEYVFRIWKCQNEEGGWDEKQFEEIAQEDVGFNREHRFRELKNLFLDITENYKKLPTYAPLLKELSEYADSPRKCRNIYRDVDKFDREYEQGYGKLMRLIMVSKIFEACYNEEVEDTLTGLEIVISEYIMAKFAVFLRWEMEGKQMIYYEDVRDYTMIFSRIIGNNIDSYLGFLEDSFGNMILDTEYMINLIKI